MISLFYSNFTNTTEKLSNATAESQARNVTLEVSYIFTIIINSITCPFTVLLNVLVIMAVKRRPRLQTNANILLICLAVTDALTGLTSQPSFILWKTFQLHSMTNFVNKMEIFHNFCIVTLLVCSCLHLMLVTCERLIAIKLILQCTTIRVLVSACWIFIFVLGIRSCKPQNNCKSFIFSYPKFMYPFRIVFLRNVVPWNTQTQTEDQNSTTTARRSGKVC